MKSYTDLEQSKKLAEILPLESADMWYQHVGYQHIGRSVKDGSERPLYFPMVIRDCESDEDIPCWSLSALLGLMPKLYEFENDPDDGGCQPNLCKGWDNNQWHIVYRPSIYITEWYNEPIDAAVEMIIWLKENNKL